jgi:hypothetical protein
MLVKRLHIRVTRLFFILLLLIATIPALITVQGEREAKAAGTRYAVVGQGWVANGTGTTDSVRRLVPGLNNINVTKVGKLVVTMAYGASAIAEKDVCVVDSSPRYCSAATATTIITSGSTGNIKITVTYNSAGRATSNYSWSSLSGGVPGSTYPDNTANAVFDCYSFTSSGQSFNINSSTNWKSVTWGAVTNNPILTGSFSITTYGSVTLTQNMRFSNTSIWYIQGTGSYDINFAGLDMSSINAIKFYGTGTYTLTGDIYIPTVGSTGGDVYQQKGCTVNTNGRTITCAALASTGTDARILSLGSSVINCGQFAISGSGYTFNSGTSTINVTDQPLFYSEFTGSGQTYNIVNFTGADSGLGIAYSGANAFSVFNINRSANSIQFRMATGSGVTTAVFTCAISNTNVVEFHAIGAWHIVKSDGGPVSLDYLDLEYSAAYPTDVWYTGSKTSNSVDRGHNTGWSFGLPNDCIEGDSYVNCT